MDAGNPSRFAIAGQRAAGDFDHDQRME